MIERFKQNIADVNGKIADAAVKAGRCSDAVTLVGVTKYVDADVTREFVMADIECLAKIGPRRCGRNRSRWPTWMFNGI